MMRVIRVAFLLLALWPAQAGAQRRIVGLGLSEGFGLSADDGTRQLPGRLEGTPLAAYSALPFELVAPVDDHFAIDVSLPIPAALLSAAVDTLTLGTSVFAEWSFGEDIRFLIGPGVGLALFDFFDDHDAGGSIAGTLRAQALVGVEFLFAQRRFGLRILTRPWLGATFGVADLGFGCFGGGGVHECFGNGTRASGGALIELMFLRYVTQDD